MNPSVDDTAGIKLFEDARKRAKEEQKAWDGLVDQIEKRVCTAKDALREAEQLLGAVVSESPHVIPKLFEAVSKTMNSTSFLQDKHDELSKFASQLENIDANPSSNPICSPKPEHENTSACHSSAPDESGGKTDSSKSGAVAMRTRRRAGVGLKSSKQ